MKLYALAFGAHPDDVEMSCGGTLSMLYRNGKPFGIVDFTRGEMGTRGNAAIRAAEAKDAAKILGADIRINLGIADSNVEINRRNLLEGRRSHKKISARNSIRAVPRREASGPRSCAPACQRSDFLFRFRKAQDGETFTSQAKPGVLLHATQNICSDTLR